MSDSMDVDNKENAGAPEPSLDELFAVASPPPSVSVKKNPTFRAVHASSFSMDASPRSSSGSENDSPLCLNRLNSRFRPKPKVRRTLSMFQKPGDLLGGMDFVLRRANQGVKMKNLCVGLLLPTVASLA